MIETETPPSSPKTKTISDLFSWARVLKWSRKREKQRKRRLCISAITIRFTVRGEMQQILTERHSGKTKQMINWSVSTFKDKLKYFRFKIVKKKTRAFKKKFLFCIIFRLTRTVTSDIVVRFSRRISVMLSSTGYVIKQLVHAFSCALSSYGALGKFGEHSKS